MIMKMTSSHSQIFNEKEKKDGLEIRTRTPRIPDGNFEEVSYEATRICQFGDHR